MDNSLAYVIPVVVLAGGFTFASLSLFFKSRERIAALNGGADIRQALAANTELNERLLEKLDSLESRLSGIERTLNEVG